MWKENQQVAHQTRVLKGGAPVEEMENIKTASLFAFNCGLSKKDSEYAYVTFCIAFTTKSLMTTLKELAAEDPNATA
ncbi:MAG: hypothetical protein WC440_02625 [Candidatus Omnitrophota bacterium]|jgi:hypothetical protein